MTGAAIAIDDVSADDTILSVKQRVFAANRKLPVHRQRLMYRPGPHGMNPLADHETLGGAGVSQDGSAELDVLLTPLTDVEISARGSEVCLLSSFFFCFCEQFISVLDEFQSGSFILVTSLAIHLTVLFYKTFIVAGIHSFSFTRMSS